MIIGTYVISALFYDSQSFFTSYGKWFVKQLQKNIDWFFHQTEMSYVLAKSIGLTKSSVTGDTRFDRVRQLRNRDNYVDFIKEFIGENKKVVVFGSSWRSEEIILAETFRGNPYTKFIVAPHDLKRVNRLQELFPEAILYSEIHKTELPVHEYEILLIDSIGLLSKLYSYADIAVVGGGFHDAGLHNILEAATFGNHYRKNPEADELVSLDGGRSFEKEGMASDFILYLLNNDETRNSMCENAEKFITKKPNSTELIVKKILS
jgi:3-deoxy-D-manno-octulosonic-acid transferase